MKCPPSHGLVYWGLVSFLQCYCGTHLRRWEEVKMCLPFLGLSCPTSAVLSEKPSSTTDFWPRTCGLTPAGGGKLWKALEWWATVRLSLLSVFSLRHNVSNHKARDSKEFLENHFNIKCKWMFTVFNCVYVGAWLWAHDAPKSTRSPRARVPGSCKEPGMGTGRTQVLWS